MFQRLGVGTNVVRKEMYDLRDKGDRHLALRPEATASDTSSRNAWIVASRLDHGAHSLIGSARLGSAETSRGCSATTRARSPGSSPPICDTTDRADDDPAGQPLPAPLSLKT